MTNTTVIQVRTEGRRAFIDITRRVAEAVEKAAVRSGIVTVYVPHTTAGVTVNENADPSVVADILRRLEELAPDDGPWTHLEGNSPAHVMAALVGCSVTVPVVEGRPALGRWQGIFLAEFDGPRTRQVLVTVLGQTRDR